MNNKYRLEVLAILRKYLYISKEEITTGENRHTTCNTIKMRPINPRDIMTLQTDLEYNKVFSYLRTKEKDAIWLGTVKTVKIPINKDAGVKDYIPTKYEKVLHECIDLLKQEGSDTKQQVLEKLEGLANE